MDACGDFLASATEYGKLTAATHINVRGWNPRGGASEKRHATGNYVHALMFCNGKRSLDYTCPLAIGSWV